MKSEMNLLSGFIHSKIDKLENEVKEEGIFFRKNIKDLQKAQFSRENVEEKLRSLENRIKELENRISYTQILIDKIFNLLLFLFQMFTIISWTSLSEGVSFFKKYSFTIPSFTCFKEPDDVDRIQFKSFYDVLKHFFAYQRDITDELNLYERPIRKFFKKQKK